MTGSAAKAERLRRKRAAAGLTQVSGWVLEADKEAVRAALQPFFERAKTRLHEYEEAAGRLEPDGQIRLF